MGKVHLEFGGLATATAMLFIVVSPEFVISSPWLFCRFLQDCAHVIHVFILIYIYIYLYIRTNIYKSKGLLIGSIGHYKDPYEQISIMDCHKGFDRWMTWPEIPEVETVVKYFDQIPCLFWVGNPEWLYNIYIYMIYMDILHEVFVKERACLDKPFKFMWPLTACRSLQVGSLSSRSEDAFWKSRPVDGAMKAHLGDRSTWHGVFGEQSVGDVNCPPAFKHDGTGLTAFTFWEAHKGNHSFMQSYCSCMSMYVLHVRAYVKPFWVQ